MLYTLKQRKTGKPKDYLCPDLPDTDWSYIAGIIDGEGYVGFWRTPAHTYPYPRITVGNTWQGLTTWLQMMLGGCVSYQSRREKTNQSPLWEWKLTSAAAVYAVLSKCLPWLLIKRDRALECIAHTEKRGVQAA